MGFKRRLLICQAEILDTDCKCRFLSGRSQVIYHADPSFLFFPDTTRSLFPIGTARKREDDDEHSQTRAKMNNITKKLDLGSN